MSREPSSVFIDKINVGTLAEFKAPNCPRRAVNHHIRSPDEVVSRRENRAPPNPHVREFRVKEFKAETVKRDGEEVED